MLKQLMLIENLHLHQINACFNANQLSIKNPQNSTTHVCGLARSD